MPSWIATHRGCVTINEKLWKSWCSGPNLCVPMHSSRLIGALNYLPARALFREAGFPPVVRLLEKTRVNERLPGSGSPVIRYASTAP